MTERTYKQYGKGDKFFTELSVRNYDPAAMQGWVAKEDEEFANALATAAFAISKRHRLGVTHIEHFYRRNWRYVGMAWPTMGRIKLTIRRSTGKAWYPDMRPLDEVYNTMAHELAHIKRTKDGLDIRPHGPEHDEVTAKYEVELRALMETTATAPVEKAAKAKTSKS